MYIIGKYSKIISEVKSYEARNTSSCGMCYNCKSGKRDNCDEIQIAGRDFDGFLRDFVVCEYTDVSPLPDSVDNLQALCIEMVGIAENIYDKLNLSAGQRVAGIVCRTRNSENG